MIIINNKKDSFVSVLLSYNILYFEGAYENNLRNLQIKLWISINKNILNLIDFICLL